VVWEIKNYSPTSAISVLKVRKSKRVKASENGHCSIKTMHIVLDITTDILLSGITKVGVTLFFLEKK